MIALFKKSKLLLLVLTVSCSGSESKNKKEASPAGLSTPPAVDLNFTPELLEQDLLLEISWLNSSEEITTHYKICNAADCSNCTEPFLGLSPISVEKVNLPFQDSENHFCFNASLPSGVESGYKNLLLHTHVSQAAPAETPTMEDQTPSPAEEPAEVIVPTIVVTPDEPKEPAKKTPVDPGPIADTTPPTNNSIAIENGANEAYRLTATLYLGSTDAHEMFVSNSAGCQTGGNWEAYKTQKLDWPLSINNGSATVYVKFRDLANNETACISDAISVGLLSAVQSPIKQILAENVDDVRWIRYKLKDATGENRPLGAKFEYSKDSVNFFPMTGKSVTHHENPTNLSSSVEGEVHYYAWDIHTDFGSTPAPNTTIRITPFLGEDETALGIPSEVAKYNFNTRKVVINRAQNYILDYSIFTDDTVANMLALNPDIVVMQIAAPVSTSGHTFERVEQLKQGLDPLDASDDVLVFAYTSAAEDLRTTLFTNDDSSGQRTALYNAIKNSTSGDPLFKFKGDGTGPSVDPRADAPLPGGQASTIATIAAEDFIGTPTNQNFAPYYLDDVDANHTHGGTGEPDRNVIFGGFFVNPGHPQWYQDMKASLLSEHDSANNIKGAAGFDELLTYFTGGGYHVDGLMIDTVDSLSPNGWNDQANTVEFEWTSKGTLVNYFGGLRSDFPASFLMVNRGLFFFNPNVPGHFALDAGRYFDAVVFESFASDNGSSEFYNENYYLENKHFVSKALLAEAQRHDLKVLSIGYVNGQPLHVETDPDQKVDPTLIAQDYDYDTVKDLEGFDFFKDSEFLDVFNMGFLHYVSDFYLTSLNNFYKGFVADDTNNGLDKDQGPVFKTTSYHYNSSNAQAPIENRIGIQYGESSNQSATLYWDVATSAQPNVRYEIVSATNQNLSENVTTTRLTPEDLKNAGPAYNTDEDGASTIGFMSFPFKYEMTNLTNGLEYFFAVRAIDQNGRYDEDQFSNIRNISLTPHSPNSGCVLGFSGCKLSFSPLPTGGNSEIASYVYQSGHNMTQTFPTGARKITGVKIANSATHLFFEISSEAAFDIASIYIDTDNSNSTGNLRHGLGADYFIYVASSGVSINTFTGALQTDWSWSTTSNISLWQDTDKKLTYIYLPLSELGDPTQLKFRIKAGNNNQYGSDDDRYHDLVPKTRAAAYTIQSAAALSQTTITVDGTLDSEWMSKISRLTIDADDHDPSVGSDYYFLTATNDANNLYILAGGDLEVTTSETFIFIDTGDGTTTGYAVTSGADYLLQRVVASETDISLKLFKYNDAFPGNEAKNLWAWDEVIVPAERLLEVAEHGEAYHEFGVNLTDLGITTADTISIVLKYNATLAPDQDVLFLNQFELID